MSADSKKQRYSWDDFEKDVPKLIRKIKKLRKRFDGIYGIPRGGLSIAVKLSHELNLPILVGGVTAKTLLVDDVADSGSTLLPYTNRKATIVTIFYKLAGGVVAAAQRGVAETVGRARFCHNAVFFTQAQKISFIRNAFVV